MEGWAALKVNGLRSLTERAGTAIPSLPMAGLYAAKSSALVLVCGYISGVGQCSALCMCFRLKSVPSFGRKAFTVRFSTWQ